MENIRENFLGSVLIIDDEIDVDATEIFEINKYLETNKFNTIKFNHIPTIREIEVLPQLAFVICDWAFSGMPEESNAENNISFIRNLFSKFFVPIFLCTTLSKDTIESFLLNEEKGSKFYKSNNASCVFIVPKDEIKNERIFSFINEWLNNNCAITVLKKWEKTITAAKNKMFTELYTANEYWPKVIYKTFKEDNNNDCFFANQEMGEFITKNLLSRIDEFKFDLEDLEECTDLEKVLEGERIMKYPTENVTNESIFHTGDIFEKEGKIYINIKRQCDLLRGNDTLYFLECTLINIIDCPIYFENNTIKIFDETLEINGRNLAKINKSIEKAFTKTSVLHQGKILEKANEIVIPCMLYGNTYTIKFKSLCIEQISNMPSYLRKGKLLVPYINILLSKFSYYFTTQGTMRNPKSLFKKKFIEQED